MNHWAGYLEEAQAATALALAAVAKAEAAWAEVWRLERASMAARATTQTARGWEGDVIVPGALWCTVREGREAPELAVPEGKHTVTEKSQELLAELHRDMGTGTS